MFGEVVGGKKVSQSRPLAELNPWAVLRSSTGVTGQPQGLVI